MSKKKNGFREWLSDNLRYIILGFAMLVILALLYIGFSLLVSLVAGTQLKDTSMMQEQQEMNVFVEDETEQGFENDAHDVVEDESLLDE